MEKEKEKKRKQESFSKRFIDDKRRARGYTELYMCVLYMCEFEFN
jgi:hypothetical protein